jgi:hypothetical protein
LVDNIGTKFIFWAGSYYVQSRIQIRTNIEKKRHTPEFRQIFISQVKFFYQAIVAWDIKYNDWNIVEDIAKIRNKLGSFDRY